MTRIAVTPALPSTSHHLAAHARPQLDVERRERLVEEDERRVGGERPRERHPLALAARELVRHPLLEAGEPDQLEQLGDARRRAAVPAVEPEGDVAADAQVREERALLRDVADAAPLRRDEGARAFDHPAPSAIVPPSARSKPAISRSSVVLPLPDAPRIATATRPPPPG